ncbi:hypothetical protein [Streptomyces prasinopilosus]|uniref:hypothetical protein n=1 Tax=Streptomyces prasinopilosus TaxID=67344 RepID=UPI0006EB3276|nr:hypothetical protein [Streptomyces prasinopilosus]
MNRIAANTAFVLTLTAAAVLTPHDTHPATGPVTAGHGWKLQTPNITHIDTQPWTIAFHDTTSRTKLTPYVKHTAAELSTHLGVKVTVSTRIVPTTVGKCPPSHTIAVRWISKPNPAHPNRSFAGACSLRGAAYSGYAYINSDYWAPGRRFHEYQRQNVIWHETAHTVGVTHPATCPKDKTGRKPLMCDVDTYTSTGTRRYSSFEQTAFKQLRTNRTHAAVNK